MIGVMSDSHDNINAIRKAVCFFNQAKCSLVLHAGDFIAPFAARELAELDCRIQAVFGNCDGEKKGLKMAIAPFGEIQREPLVFTVENIRFLLTHSHFANDKYLISGKYDVLVYGHTHKPDVKRIRETLLLNPGETGGWLTGKSTVALLDPASFEADIVYL